MKAKLIFSADGKTVYIQFASGAESLYYESKEEALFAIRGALDKKKLTADEAHDLFEEIVLAENLPDHDPYTFILPFAIMDLIREMVEEADETVPSKEEIESPYVEMCQCKRKVAHAYLHNGNGKKISPPFQFKTDGLAFVEYLLKKERITEGDSASLNTLISMLLLPEDASLN